MKAISPKLDISKTENEILEYWKKTNAFKKSNSIRDESKSYFFYDGPPFANGLPHYGHLLANTIKDTVPRYWNMRGYRVERRFGWDCHGFPVESEIEKKNNLKGRQDVVEFGVDKFNEECRSSVMHYADSWKKTIDRLGRWVDWDQTYRTMDKDFMESVWWVFSELYKKDLVYYSHKIVSYSPRNATVVSNFEANQNYQDVQDPAVTIGFELEGEPGVYLLAWTTTPWTLVSNLSLCVGDDVDYVKVRHEEKGKDFILAKSRLEATFPTKKGKEPAYEVLENIQTSDLVGKKYKPLFSYFKDNPNSFVVLQDDYVTDKDGTGIVHNAPAFGEDDYQVCKKANIPLVDPLDVDGVFKEEAGAFAGLLFNEANKPILAALKESENLVKHETIVHSYPFCDRTETPLIYRAIPSWYVAVETFKDKLIANNQSIHWVPGHLKNGRMGKWLDNARDWAISRNRFWGTPLPIWTCDQNFDHKFVAGSIKELEEKTGESIDDIHKHKIDHLSFGCTECTGTMQRITEVFDCWFESGSMPYAQKHYPFNSQEEFNSSFPADFIAEGLDQTRGWFYTLNILATALFGKPAFKNVVVNGIVCDEKGKKFSKRHKNFEPPDKLMELFGADSVRLFMLNSPVLKGENLNFSDVGVKETTRGVLLPFWNAHSFLTTYAAADGWKPDLELFNGTRKPDLSVNYLDRWVYSRLQSLVAGVHKQMEKYSLNDVVPELLTFLDELTNWYIRLSRRRFWSEGEELSKDTRAAYETLYCVLVSFSKTFAPFAPFICERIFQNLTSELGLEHSSVHHQNAEVASEALRDAELEKQVATSRRIVELGRSIRAKEKLRTRQPLQELKIISSNAALSSVASDFETLFKEELNLKTIAFENEESKYVDYQLKPNLKVLGPRLGKQLGAVMGGLAKIQKTGETAKTVASLRKGETLELAGQSLGLEDFMIVRKPKAAADGFAMASEGDVTAALDTRLSVELKKEGLARELVNRVQNLRKDSGLHVSDRIELGFSASEQITDAISNYEKYICKETLCTELNKGDIQKDTFEFSQKVEIESYLCEIHLRVIK